MLDQLVSVSNLFPILLAIVSFGFAAVAVWARTRSSHVLRVRLWRALSGKPDVDDAIIQKHVNDETSLQAYQYYSTIKATTIADAHAVIAFCGTYNIPHQLISASGQYFDLSECALKESRLPGIPGRVMLGLILFGLALTLATTLALASTKGPFLKMKESGTWLVLTHDSAQTMTDFWLGRTGTNADNCDVMTLDRRGFTETEAEAICQSFASQADASYLKESLKKQRIVLLFLFMMLLVPLRIFYVEARQISAGLTLLKKLKSKQVPTT